MWSIISNGKSIENLDECVAGRGSTLRLHLQHERRSTRFRQPNFHKKCSDTGNRTPSCRVKGGNVSRYTISDIIFQKMSVYIKL